MGLQPRELNRATLARQLLLQREPLDVIQGMRRVVALQAQEPASPYIALWNRIADFDPSELDAAFTEQAIVKATLFRITLHAVDVDDYPGFHEAMLPTLRAARLTDRRFTSTGLSTADADALVPPLVEFAATSRTKAEIEQMLADELGDRPDRGVWWALRTFAPLAHSPTGGPWAFDRRPSFVAAPAGRPREGVEASLRQLIRRYLEGFGPASVADFAQCTLQKRTVARAALRSMADELTTFEGPGGSELFDVPGAPVPDGDTPAPPRLLAMWDSILLAYHDRSRIIPADYRRLVIRRNGDVLPTLLVDGYVCGVWRPVGDRIEAVAFHPLSDGAWDGLAAEAEDLLTLLAGRDRDPYARYARWFETLPGSEVRLLPG